VKDIRTVGALLTASVDIDPTRPILTFYDDATRERTELSGATLTNWVSKTANMIVDEVGLVAGDRASIGLPPHWQTAAVLLGCWSAGLALTTRPEPADLAFVRAEDATHEWPAAERYALGLHPLGLPLRAVPDGYLDFNAEVRQFGDRFYPASPVAAETIALFHGEHERTNAEVVADAAERARRLGIAGGRVLIDSDAYPDPVDWLLAPLAVGATIVLCANLDVSSVDARAESERVTLRLPS
jgi:uncharacterized protein (TIGR03089 family)